MNQSNSSVRRMAALALLIAIILVMSYTPLGYLQIGPIQMSLLTIPVAIGAVVMGPGDGAILGGVFGLTSLFSAISGRSAMGTAMFSINPLACFVVCVVARVLMGWGTGLIFKALHKAMPKKEKLNCALAGLLAAVFNTIFFMGSLVLFFYQTEYIQNLVTSLHVSNPFAFVAVVVGLQGILEAVLCCIITCAVSVPLRKLWSK
ncbi:MAG: ECF transporter S component [Absicoccus sp.]|uniref:ECF transporter S component n=1 Tax=Absicoccus sp. TaxID=2718527 RepID=UPI002A75DAF5|nr:ECF transporter S component [Absicoccus sp.]MDY3034722.1 ECF transporter S component [Absicoccus sp.]